MRGTILIRLSVAALKGGLNRFAKSQLMGTQFDVDKKNAMVSHRSNEIPRWSPCSRTRDALVKYLQCRAKEDVVCGEAGMANSSKLWSDRTCFGAGSFV